MSALLRGWSAFARPFLLIARLRHEPVAFRSWLRTVIVQMLLVLALGSALFVNDLEEATSKRRTAPRDNARALREAQRRLESQFGHGEGTRFANSVLAALVDAGLKVRVTVDAGVPVDDVADETQANEDERSDDELSDAGVGGVADVPVVFDPPLPPDIDDEPDEADAMTMNWWQRLGLWASSLVVIQTVLLALTRDFHDRLARDLSLVAGLQPEDVPSRVAIRFDLKWLWRKLRRRMRGFLTTVAGVLALSPILVAGVLLSERREVYTVVVAVVTAYWWVVFTAARSARAWRLEEDLTPPAPLRAVVWVSEKVPGFRWFGPRWLVRFVLWSSRSMFAPARSVERDPAAFIGLSVARLVATIPVVRIALRAAVVVAAGELLERTADFEPAHVVGQPRLTAAAPEEPEQ